MRIFPTRLISEVQQEFNLQFPYLKLEFFRNRGYEPDSLVNQIMPNNRRLGDCQLKVTDGSIEIKDTMKVRDLEQTFKELFGLNVQVFRRSGNLWLQTTMTDEWTLQNQNEHGMEISLSHKAPGVEENYLSKEN